MKNSVVVLVAIRYLKDETRVYLYINEESNVYFVGIPDYNWSVEVSTLLDTLGIKEEFVMHLFTIFDEQKSTHITNQIIEWLEVLKENINEY